MNEQKKQEEQLNSIFAGLQKEVGAESAPLLQFITRHAGSIAGGVILLLLAVVGLGIWDWHQGKVIDEARAEMGRLTSSLSGDGLVQELQKLTESAPASMQLYLYLALAQSAQEAGNAGLAQQAYATAAKLDANGGIGLAAALGHASSLLANGDFAQGLSQLLEIQQQAPQAARSAQFRELLASAAGKAGNWALAYQTWDSLAKESQGAEAGYFKTRAEDAGTHLDSK